MRWQLSIFKFLEIDTSTKTSWKPIRTFWLYISSFIILWHISMLRTLEVTCTLEWSAHSYSLVHLLIILWLIDHIPETIKCLNGNQSIFRILLKTRKHYQLEFILFVFTSWKPKTVKLFLVTVFWSSTLPKKTVMLGRLCRSP